MTRLPDGIGRTIFIAALAGIMFAAFLLVTPRLTASTTAADEPSSSTTSTSVMATTTSTTRATTTTTRPEPPTTTSAPTPTTVEPRLPENGYDGTVTLGLYFEGEADGKEYGIIEAGDTIEWRLHVTNKSDGVLWGVYGYLELHGSAECDDRILGPGESTDCWIETRAVEGSHEAQAWVNAWTLTRMVKDMVFADLNVLP